MEDLALLVHVLLEVMGARDREAMFTPGVFEKLRAHDWPGNVRELRNFVERAVILGSTDLVRGGTESVKAVNQSKTQVELAKPNIEEPFKAAKERVIAAFEQAYLTQLMGWAEGNVSRAARKVGLDRMYLHHLLQRYGLKDSASKLE
jgi:DNA-binding NtrC family response regulator